MAKKLSVQVVGAPLKRDLEAGTIQELMTKTGQTGDVSAIVNQKPVSKDHTLSDGDYVIFTQNVKGAMSWDEDEDEAVDGEVAYVFQSPTLAIVRLGTCGYRVNGQKITKEQLNDLFTAVGAEMLSK